MNRPDIRRDPMLFEFEEAQKIYVRFDDQESVDELSSKLGVDLSLLQEFTFPTMNTKMEKVWEKAPLIHKDWNQDPLWKEMPKYIQEWRRPYKLVTAYLDQDSLEDFARIVNQNITEKTQYLWYPDAGRDSGSTGRAWFSTENHHPNFPVYVISKGRPNNGLTTRALDRMGIKHKVVVEPSEYAEYTEAIGSWKLLQLPFSDLNKGSIPARNWVWEHSRKAGHDWHWILDDNISHFDRLLENTKVKVKTPAVFAAAEDYVMRHTNIGMAGFNYSMFCKWCDRIPPFYLNTRVYSCLLIRNDLEFRWRGRYNEDTDLSLRVLKSGKCTVLFNAFLARKRASMSIKGGNTELIYGADNDNRRKFAESLVKQHPDVAKVIWRFNRWHHLVDYTGFTQQLATKPGWESQQTINEYGMELRKDDE